MGLRDEIVTDASVLLAVLLNEPVRGDIESLTANCELVAPGCIAWEIGNALYSALKHDRIKVDQAVLVFREFQKVPMRVLDVDIEASIRLAAEHRIPTYDAYYLQCALAGRRAILSLDTRMNSMAQALGLTPIWRGLR